MLQKDVEFKRAWELLARTKRPEEVVFGSWLAPGYARTADARDFQSVEQLLQVHADDVILDVGCGGLARALIYFGAKGCRIVGLDISVAAAAHAKTHLARFGIRDGVDLVVGDVEFLPFRAGCFDRVLAVSVMSHLASRSHILRALHELRFCAKDTALCYLSWWLNLYSPFSFLLVVGTRLGFIGQAERIQLLTFKGSSEIQSLCQHAGLAITKLVTGSVFWYVFYLFPKIIHGWNDRLLRVLRDAQDHHAKTSLPPFFFDLVAEKMVPSTATTVPSL